MKSIIFLCTGNSCRSQMAEAFARMYFPGHWYIASAGIEKHGLNPFMLRVMEEDGVEMKGHSSKIVSDLPAREWDMVITVCSHAEKNCPFLAAHRHLHLPFPDPPALAKDMKDEEEILNVYRNVRDQIRIAIESYAHQIDHE